MLFTGEDGDVSYGFSMDAVVLYRRRLLDSYYGGPRVDIVLRSGFEITLSLTEGDRFISLYKAWYEEQARPQYIVSLP